MLSWLLRKPQPVLPATIPEGLRIYAIGDVHGRLDLLRDLFSRVERDRASARGRVECVFLGDLIDRGPDSAGVVTMLMQGVPIADETHFILGNHEELLLHAARGERSALATFARVGGRETLLSYGLDPDEYAALDLPGLASAILTYVPQAHRSFFESFVDRLSIGDYRFVHAGVRPDRSFDAQKPSDLRWIRREFLDHPGPFDGVIVHGHTVSEEAEMLSQRIGIDTGAYATGRLTALVLEGTDRRLLQTQGSTSDWR